jgi:lysyl-tRNA synthetase, class II
MSSKRHPATASRPRALGPSGLACLAAFAATALVGVLTVLSGVTANDPGRSGLLLTVEPAPVMAIGHVLAATAGVALVLLARGLLAGKRRAVDVAIPLLCIVAVLHLVKGADYEESTVALGLAALLAAARGSFGRGCSSSRPALVAGILAVAAVAAAYALPIGFLLVTDHVETLGRALDQGAIALSSGGWWLRSGEPLALAFDALMLGGLIAAAVFMLELLRPEPATDGHSPGDHAHAAAIVGRYGDDSIAPFVLREDKAFFFAGGCLLAYRTLRETAVVSGDPIGPESGAPMAMAAFIDFAATRGWHVAVTAASSRNLEAYRALGMRRVRVGSEAVVDPGTFSLEGRAIRKVRQSVGRLERRGWRTQVAVAHELPAADARAIAALERDWQSARPRLYGFAMTLGRVWGAEEDAKAIYAIARRPDGRVGAFLRFIPYRLGLSLDTMRRGEDAPNGVNEALVVAALQYARERELREVSLNFAGFAHVMAPEGRLDASQRVLRAVLSLLHGRFQLERLVHFNDKFGPAWRPRYLVYGPAIELPRVAVRVLQAEAYLRPPRTKPMLARWQPDPWAAGLPLATGSQGRGR